ncbi:MAG: GtrA family protein [Pseudomonadota bacterium]
MVNKYQALVVRFSRFAIIGGLGYIVDAGLTVTLIHSDLNPFAARLIAIPVAMLVCWRLNRALTFGASGTSQKSEGARYALVAGVAAIVNYAVYSLIILGFPGVLAPLAVAAATVVSMLVSFTGFQSFAFRKT